jgi:hypothetical protein
MHASLTLMTPRSQKFAIHISRADENIQQHTRRGRLSRCDVAVEFNIMHTHLLKVAHQF